MNECEDFLYKCLKKFEEDDKMEQMKREIVLELKQYVDSKFDEEKIQASIETYLDGDPINVREELTQIVAQIIQEAIDKETIVIKL